MRTFLVCVLFFCTGENAACLCYTESCHQENAQRIRICRRSGRARPIERYRNRKETAMEQKLPVRNQVPEELTWKLEDIYEDTAAWEADVQKGLALAGELAAYEGQFVRDAETMKKGMDLYAACMETLYSFSTYASMKYDQDTANADNQALTLRAQSAEVQIAEKLSFIEPEILSLSEDRLEEYYRQVPDLLRYRVSIKEVIRTRDHALSTEMERLLASAGEMAAVPYNSFSMLISADLKFPSVTGPEGETITISNGRFVPLMMSPDRALRKEVFEKFYERYREFRNTWAALYDGQVKQQIFNARARKYASTFEAAVDGNNVDPSVCDNLIESTRRGLDKMHRYVSLRKKLLGVDELHMYDVYVPMVADYQKKVTYEEAKEISLRALAPLGEEYLQVVREAYENRWIDVVENEGKRGGAYSTGVYAVHPYMLLNWADTLDDVFTLVHEMGHSIHTWYSNRKQSFLDSRYRIFVAEVASTTNEVLLLEYLLQRAGSKQERAYLLNHYLDNFKGTLFRQVMFEEFERRTNAMAEAGQPLTADALSAVYYELNQQYFGEDMISDPLIACEWCRIPHFYYNFYVYQYATSFAAAVSIAHRILEEGETAVRPYLEFLSSGCTDDPVSLLRIAGVDMSTGRPVDEALEVFDRVISELEALYA